jgi:hypothetical protein
VLTFINATSPHAVVCVHLFQEWNSPDELILRVKGVGYKLILRVVSSWAYILPVKGTLRLYLNFSNLTVDRRVFQATTLTQQVHSKLLGTVGRTEPDWPPRGIFFRVIRVTSAPASALPHVPARSVTTDRQVLCARSASSLAASTHISTPPSQNNISNLF